MQYYLIALSSDLKIIGQYPQVRNAVVPTTVDDPKYLAYFMGKKTNSDTLVPELILDKKAKFTDLLSVGYPGINGDLVCSLRLAALLQSSVSLGFEFVSTKLHCKDNTTEDIAIAHPFDYGFQFIDFERSVIAHRKTPEQKVLFKNAEDFQRRLEADDISSIQGAQGFLPIMFHTVSILPDTNVDCFPLRNLAYGGIGFLVSQTLKDKMLEEKYTGVDFLPVQQPKRIGMVGLLKRMYDNQIERWLVIDPLSDSICRFSPDSYANNKPLGFIDLDGTAVATREISLNCCSYTKPIKDPLLKDLD